MNAIRKFIDWALEAQCDLHRHRIGWLCCKCALLSSDLDEKWGTGLWKNVVQEDDK